MFKCLHKIVKFPKCTNILIKHIQQSRKSHFCEKETLTKSKQTIIYVSKNRFNIMPNTELKIKQTKSTGEEFSN